MKTGPGYENGRGVLPTLQPNSAKDLSEGPDGPRFVVLATNVAGDGGIQRATRTLLIALKELWGRDRLSVLSVWADAQGASPISLQFSAATEQTQASGQVPVGSRIAYLVAAIKAAHRWRHQLPVVVACHVQLAPVAWAAARASGARYAVWCHGREAWGTLAPWTRLSLRRAAVVFAPTWFSARSVERAAGMTYGSVRIVRHGLSPEFRIPEDIGEKDKEEIVVSVARLDESNSYKGVDVLVRAWPRVMTEVPGARLIVVGEGSARAPLEGLVDSLALSSSIHFAGRLGDSELASLMTRARAFAMPSLTSLSPNPKGEGFGLVYLEAAAAGLPVVAAQGGATEEIVMDGVTGLLVDPENVSEVAAAITRLLVDRALAQRLGREGRDRAGRVFSFDSFRQAVSGLVSSELLGQIGGASTPTQEEIGEGAQPNRPAPQLYRWLPALALVAGLCIALIDQRRRKLWSPGPETARFLGFLCASVGPVVLTAALVHAGGLHARTGVYLYAGLMVVLGVLAGLWQALAAGALSYLLVDWFFIPPVGSLSMPNGRAMCVLGPFMVAAGVVALVELKQRA